MRDRNLLAWAEKGIVLPYAQRVLDPNNMHKMVMDAAAVTAPNVGVPIEFTYYLDPRSFEVLKSPERAEKVFDLRQFGDWTTSHARFRFAETEGRTAPYSDFANDGTSTVNYEWPEVRQFVFQTNIRYGQREVALGGEAKINIAGDRQGAALAVLRRQQNRYWFLGVENMNIYGILNDPDLPASLTTTTPWNATATTNIDIDNDILRMVAQLSTQTDGWVDQNTRFKLLVSPAIFASLGKNSQYNQTTIELIRQFLPNVEIIVVPELGGLETGGVVYLIVDEAIEGQPIADLGYGVLFETSAVVPHGPTAWVQKAWASTYGALYFNQWGVVSMTGVEG